MTVLLALALTMCPLFMPHFPGVLGFNSAINANQCQQPDGGPVVSGAQPPAKATTSPYAEVSFDLCEDAAPNDCEQLFGVDSQLITTYEAQVTATSTLQEFIDKMNASASVSPFGKGTGPRQPGKMREKSCDVDVTNNKSSSHISPIHSHYILPFFTNPQGQVGRDQEKMPLHLRHLLQGPRIRVLQCSDGGEYVPLQKLEYYNLNFTLSETFWDEIAKLPKGNTVDQACGKVIRKSDPGCTKGDTKIQELLQYVGGIDSDS